MNLAREQRRQRLLLDVDIEPTIDALDLFSEEERALLFFWLIGDAVDAGFEVLTWSRVATRNDNGRAW